MAEELLKEYADIKAGVSGVIGDVPSPSQSLDTSIEEDTPSMPTTEYNTSGMDQTQSNLRDTFRGNFQTSSALPQGVVSQEALHELVEAVVNEKFDEFMSNVGNIALWKEQVTSTLISVKQEVIRVEERFGQLQQSVLGRVKQYDESMRTVHTEMKAFEKVFEKILDPLVSHVKELGKITEELKRLK